MVGHHDYGSLALDHQARNGYLAWGHAANKEVLSMDYLDFGHGLGIDGQGCYSHLERDNLAFRKIMELALDCCRCY